MINTNFKRKTTAVLNPKLSLYLYFKAIEVSQNTNAPKFPLFLKEKCWLRSYFWPNNVRIYFVIDKLKHIVLMRWKGPTEYCPQMGKEYLYASRRGLIQVFSFNVQ